MFGDLNFRIENLPGQKVLDLIETKNYTELAKYDQLERCLRTEDCFATLQEEKINFAPTYKFKVNTNNYDQTRVPSWCDRILYKMNKSSDSFVQCTPVKYFSLPEFTKSDHKPVSAVFSIRTLSWSFRIPSVVFVNISGNIENNLEIVYRVNKEVITHTRDWIGIYQVNYF